MPKRDRQEGIRRYDVRCLFRERYMAGKRDGTDVFMFHGWLMQNRSDLLPMTTGGDTYQHLKSDLEGLWAD